MCWVVGQKHKFRESGMPFPLRDIRKKSSQHVRACAAGDGAICSKNGKIVPYHGANPNTRNGARVWSPYPIMAPDGTYLDRYCSSPQLIFVTFLLTRNTIERRNISFTKNTSGWNDGGFARVGTRLSSWTTSRMRKVGSSRPWLFPYFQVRAPLFPLLVGNFFFIFDDN